MSLALSALHLIDEYMKIPTTMMINVSMPIGSGVECIMMVLSLKNDGTYPLRG
jgi:hypothetical protein